MRDCACAGCRAWLSNESLPPRLDGRRPLVDFPSMLRCGPPETEAGPDTGAGAESPIPPPRVRGYTP